METIFFAGFYGVGKSMIGRVLASRKNLSYLDIDTAICEKEDKQIKEIIDEKGFKYYESVGKYILNHSITQGMIVSTNATIVNDEENRHLIKKTGRVIYLRARADTIYKNMQKHHEDTPIFNDDFTILQVEKYLDIYKPYYEELQNYVIDVDDRELEDLLSESIAIYNYINKPKSHIFI